MSSADSALHDIFTNGTYIDYDNVFFIDCSNS